MTVQYHGNDWFHIWLNGVEVDLHKSDIDKIQSFNFNKCVEANSVEELEQKISNLEFIIDGLNDEIEEYEKKVINLEIELQEKSEDKNFF